MCGRFAITLPPDAMAALFDAAPGNDLPEVPDYNVCPTRPVHAVLAGGDRRRIAAPRWGLLPPWYDTPQARPLLINARAETIADKPAFRQAVRERRCLIPASGFYEWTRAEDGGRLPWYIHPADGADCLAFAGIWQDWSRDGKTLTTCAIVTCAANEAMSAIHHRMPVVLAPDDWPLWLGEAGHGAARLMRPAPEGTLAMHRVGVEVNSNRAAGPGLINSL